MSDGIKVELELASGDFDTGLARANSSLQRFENQAGQAVVGLKVLTEQSKSFLSTLRDVTVVIGVAGAAISNIHAVTTSWVGEVININAQVDKMRRTLEGMSNSTTAVADAARDIKNLREEATKAPFSLAAMHQAFVRMKSGGIDPTQGAMSALTDAVAAFGGTDETLGRASLAFQEMAGKGVVQMKELRNQLGMAVPTAMKELAQATGVSYAELMSDVHTGTVNAKDAMEALFLQFERSFGGAAQRQMETFSGQVGRMGVLLQTIAITNVGGDGKAGGFYASVTAALKELNDALGGGVAAHIGDILGASLTRGIGYIRNFIYAIIEMRHTIEGIAEALAIGFSARLIIGFGAATASMVANFRAGMATMSVSIGIARAEMTALQATFSASNAAAAAGFFARAALGARLFASVLPVIGAGLTMIAPWLPILAIAVELLGDKFGLFSSKTRDAWVELERFGVTSKAQADLAYQDIIKQENLLVIMKRNVTKENSVGYIDWKTGHVGLGQNDNKAIEAKEAEIVAMKKLYGIDVAAFEVEQAKNAANKRLEVAVEVEEKIRREHRRTTENEAKLYEEASKIAAKAGRSITPTRDIYRSGLRTDNNAYYDEEIAHYKNLIDKQTIIRDNASRANYDTEDKYLDALEIKKIEFEKQKARYAKTSDGLVMDKKPIDDAKLFKKGEDFLQKQMADIAGYRAALQGADQDVVALNELMKEGKYGDWGTLQNVKDLVAEITTAKQLANDLNEVMKGDQKYDSEVTNLLIKKKEELWEAQHHDETMTDSQKLDMKMREGFFAGLGTAQNPAQQRMIDLRNETLRAGVEAKKTGDIFNNHLFGSTAQSAASGFLSIVEKIANAFQAMSAAAGGMNLTKALEGAKNAFGYPTGGPLQPGNNVSVQTGDTRDLQIRTVYGEAASQSEEGQAAVAWVMRNRLQKGGYGGSMEDVLFQQKAYDEGKGQQFSVWNKGDAAGDMARNLSKDDPAYIRMGELIDKVNQGLVRDPTRGALNYYNPQGADPSWANSWNSSNSGMIGAHRFGNRDKDYSATGIEGQLKPEQEAKRSELSALEAQVQALVGPNRIKDAMKKYQAELDNAEDVDPDGQHKRLGALSKSIKTGEFDPKDLDVESAKYKDMIALVNKLDAAEVKRNENKKNLTAGKSSLDAIAKEKKDLDAVRDELQRESADPDSKKTSKAQMAYEKKQREYMDSINTAYGPDSASPDPAKVSKALAETSALTATNRDNEYRKDINALHAKTEAAKQSVMTQEQARDDVFNKEIERYSRDLANFKGTEEEKIKLVAKLHDYIEARQAAVAAASPIGKMAQGWADVGNNIEKTIASGANSGIDALATVLTGGKANIQQMVQQFAKGIVTDILKYSLSGIMGSMGGGVQGILGILGKLTGGGGGLFGVAHTGGLVGGSLGYRAIDANVFSGAPRFHSGGMVGSDEVPIIARRGEGVFTPEQMTAMGQRSSGAQGVTVTNHIAVNASGGSAQQNADLAQQVGVHVERIVRSTVIEELRSQQRPGNMMR
jgi:tape measure domain-containing protein